jgi:hypothetical protein
VSIERKQIDLVLDEDRRTRAEDRRGRGDDESRSARRRR